MHKIVVDLPFQSYPIYIGTDILALFGETLRKHSDTRQLVVISEKEIFNRYGEELLSGVDETCQVQVLLVPGGEQSKSLKQTEALYTKLLQKKFERGTVIVALGGGVVGDLAGFVAATYLRGVPFVQVPTTLLAQVDSSIGGKTGVNHKLGKNLIGAFKQPLFVFSDTALLQSLPDAEIRCGLGEVIKYGFILNRSFFDYLNVNLAAALSKEAQVLEYLVRISADEKAKVVAADEKEQHHRMLLNFGHTFGHALEAEFGYSGLKHGEAVILGMQCALDYRQRYGQLSEENYRAGMDLLKRVPVKLLCDALQPDILLEHMRHDKKVKDKRIRLVVSDEIGRAFVDDTAEVDQLREVWRRFVEAHS